MLPLLLCLALENPIRIESHGGRVELLAASAQPLRLGRGAVQNTDPRGHLETGAGAKARIVWPLSGSAEIAGRGGFQWEAGGLRVFECERLELEVRRGPLRIEAQAGWTLLVERGALVLQSDPLGGYTLEQRAGLVASLTHRSGPFLRSAPLPSPGQRCRLLPYDQTSSPATLERHPAWQVHEWPWGADLQPASEPAPQDPTAAQPVHPPATQLPEQLSPTPAASFAGRPLDAWWRLGPLVFQRHPELTVEPGSNGGWSLRLSNHAHGAARVYGQDSLHELEPGGLIVFDAQGRTVAYLGAVQPVPEPLPPHSQRSGILNYP